jgi:glycosyltransferase involved in cell wall biosynthesis
MKLLFLLPSVPTPPDAGAKMRNLGLLRLAAQDHEVDAIAFGPPAAIDGLAPLVRRGAVVPPPPTRHPVRRALDVARSSLPDMAQRLWSTQFLESLHRFLATERYDAVQAEAIEMARYLRALRPRAPEDSGPCRVYDAHNPEFLLQRRAFDTALARGGVRGAAAAAYSFVQWRRLERFERGAVRASRLALAVSYHDANQLEALAPGSARVHVVPNGIDVQRYPFRLPDPGDAPNLLFLGKLDYRPNVEALGWLVTEVLPRLFARLPKARLFVVGDSPPVWLVAAGQRDDRIAVTGPVPDERPYLARAAALVLPMRVGGGSRVKALVALASGVPIVSTLVGMEGLEAEMSAHYLCADTADEWTQALAHLLGDTGLRRRLARSGRVLVERRYDWSAIAPSLREAYAALEDGARPR